MRHAAEAITLGRVSDDRSAAERDRERARVRACRAALALTLAEPVLALAPFGVTATTDDARMLPGQLVLAITPTDVHVYACSSRGGVDVTRQLAAWSRAALRVSVALDASGVVLVVTTPAGDRIDLHAASHAETDVFVALITHRVSD
jgi:hypothetical protein